MLSQVFDDISDFMDNLSPKPLPMMDKRHCKEGLIN